MSPQFVDALRTRAALFETSSRFSRPRRSRTLRACFRLSLAWTTSTVAWTTATSAQEQPSEASAPFERAAAEPSEAIERKATIAATPDEETTDVRLLFGQGVALLEQTPPDYERAHARFSAAYEASGHSWKVLGNLGLCAWHLERFGEALAHFRRYLEEGGDQVAVEERAAIELEIAELRAQLVSVTLSTIEPEVRLSVRREGAKTAPQIYTLRSGSTRLALHAGALQFVAEARGARRSWGATLEAGQEVSHALEFITPLPWRAPLTRSVPLDSLPREFVEPPGWSPLEWAGVGAGAVGGATLAAGALLFAFSRESEADSLDACRANACPSSSPDRFERAIDDAELAQMLLSSGGLLTAAGLAVFFLAGDEFDAERIPFRVRPLATSSGAGVSTSGSFD